MNFSGADRTRQLVTVGIGTLLLLVMGGVLIAGFRLATTMNAKVQAVQTASVLQTYPNTIASQLNSLRDRLEARAYAGQALADVRATVEKFDQEMKQLNANKAGDSTTLDQATSLWAQYGPVIDPVIDFHGQPYVDYGLRLWSNRLSLPTLGLRVFQQKIVQLYDELFQGRFALRGSGSSQHCAAAGIQKAPWLYRSWLLFCFYFFFC